MKVLVTGAGGMLGADLYHELSSCFDVTGTGRNPSSLNRYVQADLTSPKNVSEVFSQVQPSVVIHAAAMTDVDGCEGRSAEAALINFDMTRFVADEANRAGALLIFFSTDYVFSGHTAGELTEDESRNPLNVYGETKLSAEKYIEQNSKEYVIFRITWLYGINGKSFPRTILEKARTQKVFDIVHDQIGRPTYTRDVASAIRKLLTDNSFTFEKNRNSVYHLGNNGSVSWADFADYIFKNSGHSDLSINRITAKILNRPAKRPENSVLCLNKIKNTLHVELRPWNSAILDFINEFQRQDVSA